MTRDLISPYSAVRRAVLLTESCSRRFAPCQASRVQCAPLQGTARHSTAQHSHPTCKLLPLLRLSAAARSSRASHRPMQYKLRN
jgi:hypothetical protein